MLTLNFLCIMKLVKRVVWCVVVLDFDWDKAEQYKDSNQQQKFCVRRPVRRPWSEDLHSNKQKFYSIVFGCSLFCWVSGWGIELCFYIFIQVIQLPTLLKYNVMIPGVLVMVVFLPII